MGMSMGMIGALGGMGNGTGVGGALMAQGSFLQKQEEADLEMGRTKSLQSWLMQAREEYTIKSEDRAYSRMKETEGRSDARTKTADIERDARTWQNEQDRAPVKRVMKAADKSAEFEGDLKSQTDNIDTLAGNKGKMTEASMTADQKREHAARATLAEASAQEILDGTKRGLKMPGPEHDTVKALDDQIKTLSSEWSKGVLSGAIVKDKDGQLGTPEQRGEFKRLAVLRQQRNDIAAPFMREQRTGNSNPLNRGVSPSADGDIPRSTYGNTPNEDDNSLTFNSEYKRQKGILASATDPEEKSRAQTDMTAIEGEAKRMGVTLDPNWVPPAGTVVAKSLAAQQAGDGKPIFGGMMGATGIPDSANQAPTPAPAAPLAVNGDPNDLLKEVDSARSELKDFTASVKPPGLAAGEGSREEYARKVQSLKEKIKAAQSRYYQAASSGYQRPGGGGAAFSYARP